MLLLKHICGCKLGAYQYHIYIYIYIISNNYSEMFKDEL